MSKNNSSIRKYWRKKKEGVTLKSNAKIRKYWREQKKRYRKAKKVSKLEPSWNEVISYSTCAMAEKYQFNKQQIQDKKIGCD